jgi:hypothetical protein
VTNLLAHLGDFWRDVLRFAHDPRVPFDNLAEPDISMVNPGRRSPAAYAPGPARARSAIRSDLATAPKQGVDALDAPTSNSTKIRYGCPEPVHSHVLVTSAHT